MAGAPREQWSSRSGFLLAAIGSAVGLGNMWRFSYLTAENGGAAFVLLYVAITLLVGLPVLLAELVIGRGAQKGPIEALGHFGGPAWRPLGYVFAAAGFLILSYYGVIAGWTVRYAGTALLGFDTGIGERFADIAQGGSAVGFHVLFMTITVWVVSGGVKAGIERTALVLMPMLFALVCGLALYAATLDGAGAGYAYYLQTDFSEIASFEVLTQAAGQAFFSLSLGMGAMLTFGSYLSRDNHLPNESLIIAGADVGIAFLAGLVVFPLIFALNLSDQVGGSTVGALFITLPTAFADMGGGVGRVVGSLFFAALLVGALTSAISLLEVVVACAIDGLGWERRRAAFVFGAIITLCGIPAALSLDVLGAMDEVANNIFLLGGGLGLAIFVGWVMKDPIAEVSVGAGGVPWFGLWRGLLRFAVPIGLVIVLYNGVPVALKAVGNLFASTP